MRFSQSLLALGGLFLGLLASGASAASLSEHVLGSPSAPVTVIGYSSVTCSHCAHFYNDVLPKIEERYIKTGKVRLVFREFPLDGIALKSAALANCLPQSQFFPFITVLYRNREAWLSSPKPETVLIQYAKLAGLNEASANACLQNTDLLDNLIAMRSQAIETHNIRATPTFIINEREKLMGAQNFEVFAAAFDKILAGRK